MRTLVMAYQKRLQSSCKGRVSTNMKGRQTDAASTVQNAEIFTLTYGSIVRQLITDLEDIEEVNKQLDTMCAAHYLLSDTTN